MIIRHYAITSSGGHNDVKPIDTEHNFDASTIAFQTLFCLKENGEEIVFVATTPGSTLCGENAGCIRSYVMFAPHSSDFPRYGDFMWEILTEVYGVLPRAVFEGLPDDILLVPGKMPANSLSIDYLKKYAPNKKKKAAINLQ
ncbi:MAG: hypothetical protein ACM3L5_00470 [Candidatus Saccharibacteria bacterium]